MDTKISTGIQNVKPTAYKKKKKEKSFYLLYCKNLLFLRLFYSFSNQWHYHIIAIEPHTAVNDLFTVNLVVT